MDLISEPDTYAPSVNELGNYIDVIPSFHNYPHGVRCHCGCRKGKSYHTQCAFSAHTKTKTHQNWLCNLTLNKTNYYIECENLKNTVKDQRLMIARLDKEIQNKTMTIDYLTKQLVTQPTVPTSCDLLLFD